MKKRIIFMDLDGVINDHTRHPNGYCGTKPSCVAAFNRILREVPDAAIVVSSAWRYLVHSGVMDLRGLTNLLLTHGLDCHGRVVGVTRRDGQRWCFNEDGASAVPYTDRGPQIADWLAVRPNRGPYVVLDDLDLGITGAGHPFVHVDGTVGLTDADAERAIAILKGSG